MVKWVATMSHFLEEHFTLSEQNASSKVPSLASGDTFP